MLIDQLGQVLFGGHPDQVFLDFPTVENHDRGDSLDSIAIGDHAVVVNIELGNIDG